MKEQKQKVVNKLLETMNCLRPYIQGMGNSGFNPTSTSLINHHVLLSPSSENSSKDKVLKILWHVTIPETTLK